MNKFYKFHYKKFCAQSYVNIERIAKKLGVTSYSTINKIKEEYDRYSYEADILPSLYEYTRNFNYCSTDLQKMVFLKKKDFFFPEKTKSNIERLQLIYNYLIKEFGFLEKEATEIVFLEPQMTENYSNIIIKNITFLSAFFGKDFKKVLIDYPKLLTVKEDDYNKIVKYFQIYLFDENIEKQEIENLLKENPLLLTIDTLNLNSHLEFLSNIKKEIISHCEKRIAITSKKREFDRNDYFKVKKMGDKLNKDYQLPLEDKMKSFKMYDIIKSNPYYLLYSSNNFIELIKILEERLQINSTLAFNLIQRYPDISFLNRNKLFNKKIDILFSVGLDKYCAKHFIKEYPFILTKSFASYAKKYNFLKNDCSLVLDVLDDKCFNLYPLILLFSFHEIKAKMSILNGIKAYQRENLILEQTSLGNQMTQELRKFEKCNLITEQEAFSIKPEEFCSKVGVSFELYKSYYDEEGDKDTLIHLEERDLLFYYNKYTYI